jgi:hypothetical protein
MNKWWWNHLIRTDEVGGGQQTEAVMGKRLNAASALLIHFLSGRIKTK